MATNKLGTLPPWVWGSDYPKLISYVDEAGHAKDARRTFLCLAGLVAREAAWKRFDEEWRAVCAEEGISLPFHMADFAGFRGQFKGWTEEKRIQALGRLVQAVKHAHAIPIGSVVSVKDFNAFEATLKDGMKDPYFMAFQPLTFHMAVAASMEEPIGGPVAMIYAHHPEHSDGLGNTEELWEALRRHNPIVALFMESYVCGEQKEHTPLQAADIWAYELGHHFEVIRPAGRTPRWAFQEFVKIGLNYRRFTHDFITFADANGVNGLGLMSRVQRWKEISLLSPSFVDRTPPMFRPQATLAPLKTG